MRLRERGLLVRHAALGDDGGAGGRQTLLRDLQRLLDHLGGSPGSKVETTPTLLDLVGRDADERLAARAASAAVTRGLLRPRTE